jgi:hypothetical protein
LYTLVTEFSSSIASEWPVWGKAQAECPQWEQHSHRQLMAGKTQ